MAADSQQVGSTGCENCESVGESEMLVVKDLNMDYPWKGGNKYARICPECRSRTFCAASYWESEANTVAAVAYVIPKGEGDPKPLYRCPYTDDVVDEGDPCGEEFLGAPFGEEPLDECPECARPLSWDSEDETDPDEETE